MPMQPLSPTASLSAALMLVLALAVWFDLGERRIPNAITVGGLVASLVLRSMMGAEPFWSGVSAAALGLSLGILFFAVGAIGAGDGKLLASVGGLLGLDVFLRSLPLVGAFGGLLALAVSIHGGTLRPTLIRFRDLLFYFVSFGRVGDRETLSAPGAVTVPYGLAVAAGTLLAWLGWGPVS